VNGRYGNSVIAGHGEARDKVDLVPVFALLKVHAHQWTESFLDTL